MTLTIGSLCSGYGGLDEGVRMILDARPAWFCEYADGPSKILAHHWPELPNHRDLTTTDWAAVEPVDIITAGWPCQPWSLAGKRKGAADERAIWPAIAGAIRTLRPRYVFLENVSAVVAVGELERATGDLARLGYMGAWRCLRASDVGAPHGRNRCFIAAAHPGGERLGAGAGQQHGAPQRGQGDREPRRRTATHTSGIGRGEGRPEPAREQRGPDAAERGAPPVDWGRYAAAVHRWQSILGRRAPLPTEPGARGGQRLNPALVEWMMGLPAGWVTEVPDLSRNEQLKALGNGVVPQQAAAAYRDLLTALPAEAVAA